MTGEASLPPLACAGTLGEREMHFPGAKSLGFGGGCGGWGSVSAAGITLTGTWGWESSAQGRRSKYGPECSRQTGWEH